MWTDIFTYIKCEQIFPHFELNKQLKVIILQHQDSKFMCKYVIGTQIYHIQVVGYFGYVKDHP